MTEQDVINEEMYEEEDDDLPLQYRRLTAHLQTGSVDFNRRLAAYLTNQVAMRSAMDHMINNSYAQQYPNAPQFAHNHNHPPFSPPMSAGGITQSPIHGQRSVPYPSPHQAGFKHPHNRSYSTAAMPAETSDTGAALNNSPPSASPHERRMSTPAGLTSSPPSRALKTDDIKPDPDHQRQTQSAKPVMSTACPPFWQDMGPFTTALPPESQQMLGPALDPRDPMTSMLMAGSENFTSSPYYPWGGVQASAKLGTTHPSFAGMFTTLAPSALENSPDLSATAEKARPNSNEGASAASIGLDFNVGQDNMSLTGIPGLSTGLTRENSTIGLGSGQITPGEGFWDSFVQDGGWGEETTAK